MCVGGCKSRRQLHIGEGRNACTDKNANRVSRHHRARYTHAERVARRLPGDRIEAVAD